MKKKLPYLLPSFVFFLGAPIVWFLCFREVPLRISPETTYLTEPTTTDGKSIDWFKAIKERFEPKIEPEQNGFRKVAAALGPSPYFNETDWYWPELCRELDLDPNLAPTLTFEPAKEYMKKAYLLWLESSEPVAALESTEQKPEEPTDSEKLDARLKSEPWTEKDFPFMLRWIEENSPLLDLAAEALRRDYFFVPRIRDPEHEGTNDSPYSFHGNRTFPRNLEESFYYRLNYRLGRGDVDGAWDDAVSILRIRFLEGPRLTSEPDYYSAPASLVLRGRQVSQEQRRRFLAGLDRLPPRAETSVYLEFWLINNIRNLELYQQYPEIFTGRNPMLNWNVVARELNRYFALLKESAGEIADETDPDIRKEIAQKRQSDLMTPPSRSAFERWLGKPVTVVQRSKEFAWADNRAYFQYHFFRILGEDVQSLNELRERLEE